MTEELKELAGTANTKDWLEATKDMKITAYPIWPPPSALGIDNTLSEKTWKETAARILRNRADAWQRLAKL